MPRKAQPQRLILCCPLCPGDVCTMTAAVESLHAAYPGEYLTDVRTPCAAIWESNPHVTEIPDDDPDARRIELKYDRHTPGIHQSNQVHTPFLAGYTTDLAAELGRPIPLCTNRPCLYLSQDEKNWIDQVQQHVAHGRKIPFWLVNAGCKPDYTLKQWPVEHYQQVVDLTRGRIQWVQIGSNEHEHPDLDGVIDLRGKTDLRQLIRLAWHAQGGLGPVTLLQHLLAAFEKPYVCLLGGREPVPWVTYPLQHTLHTLGALDCCRTSACWKSRAVPAGDGDSKDDALCSQPVLGMKRAVGKCMALITPGDVLGVLRRYMG